MKNTDLRIGNWVSLKGCHKQVVWVKYSKICVMNGYPSSIVDLEDIKPISLTEEILLKCGFTVYDIKYGYFSHKDVPGILQLFDGVAEYSIDSNEVCWVNGLHQLQNLYHALTGQELKIEL